MLPDRVSNPGPLTYESGVLPIALRGPAGMDWTRLYILHRPSMFAVEAKIYGVNYNQSSSNCF